MNLGAWVSCIPALAIPMHHTPRSFHSRQAPESLTRLDPNMAQFNRKIGLRTTSIVLLLTTVRASAGAAGLAAQSQPTAPSIHAAPSVAEPTARQRLAVELVRLIYNHLAMNPVTLDAIELGATLMPEVV